MFTIELSTPQWLFDTLHNEFDFSIDVCATDANAKCPRYYTKEQDGLAYNWNNERVFCNPPYGRAIGLWVQKLAEGDAELCVALLPARTDTK